MLCCVITVWYVGLDVKVGKSIRGMWWSRTRGDRCGRWCLWRVCGVDSMCVVVRECSFGLYVGVSMCELVLRECVDCISAVFCRYDAVAWELEVRLLVCECGLYGEAAWGE